jgi:hypothetical protein
MVLRKRLAAFTMAAVLVITSAPVFVRANTADPITVTIDGRILSFENVQPQIVNDRTMVPVRELGEALGARVEWDGDTQSVLLIKGNRFATLRINSEAMIFGEFEIVDDVMDARSAETLRLESPPVIVDDWSVFPLHAVVQAFGVEQPQWVSATRTVVITTGENPQEPEPTPAPEQTPAPTPQPTEQVQVTTPQTQTNTQAPTFPDTEFFREVSGRRVQDMHTARNRFAVVVFDGREQSGFGDVQRAINAATRAGYQLFGFDINNTTGRHTGPENLEWVWETKNASDAPFLVLSFSGREDYFTQNLASEGVLVEMFENMTRQNPQLPSAGGPGSGSAVASSPSPSPSPSPTPRPGTGDGWFRVDLPETQAMYDENEAFVLFVYSTSDHDVEAVRDMVRDVAAARGVELLVTTNVGAARWIHRYVPSHGASITDQVGSTPLVMIVYGRGHVIPLRNVGIGSRGELENQLWSFLRRSQ